MQTIISAKPPSPSYRHKKAKGKIISCTHCLLLERKKKNPNHQFFILCSKACLPPWRKKKPNTKQNIKVQCKEGMNSKAEKCKNFAIRWKWQGTAIRTCWLLLPQSPHKQKYQPATTCLTVTAGSSTKKCPCFY